MIKSLFVTVDYIIYLKLYTFSQICQDIFPDTLSACLRRQATVLAHRVCLTSNSVGLFVIVLPPTLAKHYPLVHRLQSLTNLVDKRGSGEGEGRGYREREKKREVERESCCTELHL